MHSIICSLLLVGIITVTDGICIELCQFYRREFTKSQMLIGFLRTCFENCSSDSFDFRLFDSRLLTCFNICNGVQLSEEETNCFHVCADNFHRCAMGTTGRCEFLTKNTTSLTKWHSDRMQDCMRSSSIVVVVCCLCYWLLCIVYVLLIVDLKLTI